MFNVRRSKINLPIEYLAGPVRTASGRSGIARGLIYCNYRATKISVKLAISGGVLRNYSYLQGCHIVGFRRLAFAFQISFKRFVYIGFLSNYQGFNPHIESNGNFKTHLKPASVIPMRPILTQRARLCLSLKRAVPA